jgi:hypothetical protein
VFNRSLYDLWVFIEGDNSPLMRFNSGNNLCHILIEQSAILDFALYDDINGHSIIHPVHLRYTSPPNESKQDNA